MDVINQLVASLAKEEIRYFKIFAGRLNQSPGRKDFLLMDYIRSSGAKYNEAYIANKLYGKTDKAAFYRLKNRLSDYLGDYLTFHHLWKNESSELNRYISLYNIFQLRSEFRVAHFYLKKAEKKAITGDNLEMLDIIYGNFVRLSADLQEINPEEYILKRRENAGRLNNTRDADQAIATLSYRLKVTQNLSPDKSETLKVLDKTIKEFARNGVLRESRSFRTRIFRAVSQILLQRHDYLSLEKFLKQNFALFNTRNWFDKDNHELKLQMLTYLINTLFRLNNYKESLVYADELGQAINEYGKLLYDKYLFFYYNSLVINYSAIDIRRAFNAVVQFETLTRNRQNSYYDQFVHFNKALLLHEMGKYTEAIRSIVKLYVNDNYQKADSAFKLKIAVAELMMHYDSGDGESFELRVRAVNKDFNALLTKGDFEREKELISLMDKMIHTPGYRRNGKLKQKAINFIEAKIDLSVLETEMIKYGPWMSLKWR
jgi:hypothetical protein